MSDLEKEKEGVLQKALEAAQKVDETNAMRNTVGLIEWLLVKVTQMPTTGIEEAQRVVGAHGWLQALKADLESKLEARDGN